MGKLRLFPNTLALSAVQRHTAASRSAKPLTRVQHGVLGGFPTTRCTKSFNKLAHTPNLSVSLGHFPFDGGLGAGDEGLGAGDGGLGAGDGALGAGTGGLDGGGHVTLFELTIVNKRMLKTMKITPLEAIVNFS
ncbi:hypothetical protein SASPL_157558 [Salvia splendens]|uniref:Uncharacterized protein n=1 Tax=Salvia splendens TaxID=180675 RepID=A0A8X8VUQ6_SALSN|nr:hypothetical protein SASPL_157558 [Salvia splendens]